MGAHYFGGELEKTKRFQLGELLGRVTRHLLLMTATPHTGKEEDFQLFLTLLDRDRFEGKFREGVHAVDTSGLMRRMVKEDLLTFDGKPLFPSGSPRPSPTSSPTLEHDLYEEVTAYVREEMNRADELDGKRRNTVGFALTVLQRRLASSPEAIYQSLRPPAPSGSNAASRTIAGGTAILPTDADRTGDLDDFDDDELDAEEVEELEEEVVDAATAARTVEELDAEIARAARPDRRSPRGSATRAPTASGPSCAAILEDNALAARRRRRRRASSSSSPSTATRSTTSRRSIAHRCSAGPRRSSGIHGGVRRERAPPDHRRVHARTRTCQVLSPPTPPARASTSSPPT